MVDAARGYVGTDPGRQLTSVVPTERIVARIRRRGIRLLLPVIILLAVVGGGTYALFTYRETWETWTIIGGGAAIILLFVLWPFVAWLNRRVIITTRRVISRRGFFIRERRELFHSRGYQITTKRGPFQALAGTATILLTPGAEDPLVLHGIPSARLTAETLSFLIEKNQVIGGATEALNR